MTAKDFLTKHRNRFGTTNGMPGAFEREILFSGIKNGSQVGVVTPHGGILQGRAVMHNARQRCWVLNLGGAHGTPGIADAFNTIYVGGAEKLLGYDRKRKYAET